MKEATGELNMTVVTVVAIAAIAALLWGLWPSIQKSITDAWGDTNCTNRDIETGECLD